jgi:outer membrane protein TolC
MQNLSFPTKVAAAGRVALAEARAAGNRFAAAKFDLQRRVLDRYFAYALQAEKVRLREADRSLTEMGVAAARSRVDAGGLQQSLLDAETADRLAVNEIRTLRAEQAQTRAALNALLGRAPDAPLQPPGSLPAPRPLLADDAQLLLLAADNNPELKTLVDGVHGRQHALELARLQYLPDINPFAGINGSIEQFAGAAITLATTIPQIRAGIAEARTMLHRSEAELRQAQQQRGADVVAALVALRNSERQASFLQDDVLPVLELKTATIEDRYATGAADLADIVESQRATLELRMLISEARILREQKLAEIEALVGVDVETLAVGDVALREDDNE